MADPATLTLVAAGLAAGGALVSGGSMMAAGEAQADAASANAKLAMGEGRQRNMLAQIEAQRLARQNRRFQGKTLAALVASGGAPGDALADLAREQEIDQRLTLLGGTLASREGRNQRDIYRFQGKASRTQGYVGGIGTLLTGGGTAVMMGAK